MSLSEFTAISRYFKEVGSASADPAISLGIGDDAAVVSLPAGRQLVVSTDTLVEGIHFPVGSSAERIAYRALAVSLSDLAAMGAEPRWYTLCLTLPELQPQWLEGFCRGLVDAAASSGISLIGGDTTRGPLTVSAQVMGQVVAGSALARSGARPGDAVCVTGSLGDAAAGLAAILEKAAGGPFVDHLIDRFWRPTPRLLEAGLIRDEASSCVDISDGLLADLGHICERSGVAVRLDLATIPLSNELIAFREKQALTYAMSGGDDYELCFTLPGPALAAVEQRFSRAGLGFSCIGQVIEGKGVHCINEAGEPVDVIGRGYEHFSE